MTDHDIEYLRECLEAAPFTPYPWDGEDKNLAAFRSKDELIAWYCQPPGKEGEPYRDRGFYTRELAMLSRIVRPRAVVELGTSLGIGTCLLRWLNPTAHIVTVDLDTETFLPGDHRVPMGYLAKWQQINCQYVRGPSWMYGQVQWSCDFREVDLCFIDADHSYESVLMDSEQAWDNRATDNWWAIAWHDHNDRHPGVVQAVSEFCASHGVRLRSRSDSDTVWVIGE